MNSKSLAEIQAVDPEPQWEKFLETLKATFDLLVSQIVFDEENQEIRIGRIVVIQPDIATENGHYCKVDEAGQVWCKTGSAADEYIAVESKAMPVWRIGYLVPLGEKYAWQAVRACIYNDQELFAVLCLILDVAKDVWEIFEGNANICFPQSEDDVINLPWMGLDD